MKPVWAQSCQRAGVLVKEATELIAAAQEQRCAVRDSAGARCTADAYPRHAHRVSDEDRP